MLLRAPEREQVTPSLGVQGGLVPAVCGTPFEVPVLPPASLVHSGAERSSGYKLGEAMPRSLAQSPGLGPGSTSTPVFITAINQGLVLPQNIHYFLLLAKANFSPTPIWKGSFHSVLNEMSTRIRTNGTVISSR